ncbi:MAG: SAM-dependent methyltransferase [Pyrinomonadaceae bacterium]
MSSKEIVQAAAPDLLGKLCERIDREGQITFHDWMQAALYDEHHGYYRRHDRQRWGREGDYRTSPERSDLFAATFARYFAMLYEELGSPPEWTICEAGAGGGRFAQGVLETLQDRFPRVFRATRYVIHELSDGHFPSLRAQLESFAARIQFTSLNDVGPLAPGIIFSNELLDAFAVHRVTVAGGKLCEFYVVAGTGGAFAWRLGPPSSPKLVEYFAASEIKLAEGQVAEVNLKIEEWLTQAAAKLDQGYLITVDYGADAVDLYNSAARFAGTLRSYYQHRLIEDVLGRPGEQDITSTVNWTFVERVTRRLGLKTIKFERQDKFLLEAGLLEELEWQSWRATTEAEKLRLSVAAREMILPSGMASSFQVLVQRR